MWERLQDNSVGEVASAEEVARWIAVLRWSITVWERLQDNSVGEIARWIAVLRWSITVWERLQVWERLHDGLQC